MDTLDTPFDTAAAKALADRATALMDPLAVEIQAQATRRAELLARPAGQDLPPADGELLAHPPRMAALLEALPEVPVLLSVRSPAGQETEAVAQAWDHLQRLARSLGAPVSEYDTRLDEVACTIRVNAHPNLVLALIQEQDYFWSVALAEDAAIPA